MAIKFNEISFTVLIPVFNTKAPELIECVYSISKNNQTIEQDYEILLVDDGSTDLQTKLALDFLQTTIGVKVITRKENGGSSAALNDGHEYIKTDWIALCDSSDISYSDRFKKQIEHLVANPDIDVLGTNLISFKNEPLRTQLFKSTHEYIETLKRRPEGWLTNHGTVFYKRESVKKVGGYDLKLRRAQDVDLWKRMYNSGMKIRTLPDVLYAWRK
jgi:glycosyltransferase involved in cell wall biosynthesis